MATQCIAFAAASCSMCGRPSAVSCTGAVSGRMQHLGLAIRIGQQSKQHTSLKTVCMVLPSGNREATLEREKQAKWAASAIKAFSMAELEARKLKYSTTGTEALLMGILTEGTSKASLYLRANGIMLFKVREETVKLLGKADMYFFSPEHPPLTGPAQKALDWAVDEHAKIGSSEEITNTLLLLGIWAQKDSAGQKVLATLGFDDTKAEELLASVQKQELSSKEAKE